MADVKSFIVFRVKDQNFAYETDKVVETVRITSVFPVPMAPDYIRGVMNLRNNVIPLVDLRKLLWDETSSSNTAIIVKEGEANVGLMVDSVKDITEVDPKDIKKVKKKEMEGLKREFVRGMVERENEVVFLLDLKTITEKRRSRKGREAKKIVKEVNRDRTHGRNLRGFVVFPAGKEWFALPVEEVREIIDYPSNLSRIPKAPAYVEGVFLLRGEDLVLVSFCRAVGVEGCGEERRAIVITVNRRPLAVGVEDVKEIRWVEEESILPMERDGSRGVIALDGGERIVLIVSGKDIVNPDEIEDISADEHGKDVREEVKEMRSFVWFTVGDVEMAISIEKVKEVVEVDRLTQMPGSPDHIEGVYNLRNSVIAISSLPRRLGMEADVSDKVIVLESVPVGFKVTRLKGILRVPEEDIQPADQITGAEERVLEGVIKTKEGGVIFVLDPEKVLKEEDLRFLEEGVVKDGEG